MSGRGIDFLENWLNKNVTAADRKGKCLEQNTSLRLVRSWQCVKHLSKEPLSLLVPANASTLQNSSSASRQKDMIYPKLRALHFESSLCS